MKKGYSISQKMTLGLCGLVIVGSGNLGVIVVAALVALAIMYFHDRANGL